MKKWYVLTGLLLLVPAIVLFAEDVLSIHSFSGHSILLYLLSALAFAGAILTGRKLAAYVHDLHLSRERHRSVGPALFIYFWLFAFIFFLLLYTGAKLAFGYFVKILLLPLGGAYLQVIYNFLGLAGAYLTFAGIYHGREDFLTMWGRTARDVENISRDMPKKALSAPLKGADAGAKMMNGAIKSGMDAFIKQGKKK